MRDLNNKVAVVTGAASGIGRSLAVNLAKEGCSVAMADVDRACLFESAEMIKSDAVRKSTHIVDVASHDQVYQFAEDVIAEHGKVNIVINNAGVALAETLEDVRYDDFEWLLGINLWGVIYGSKAFLPYLKKQPEAHIVNISSVHGLFTNPNVGPYCTSKFAVRGFTQSLCQELRGSSVWVSCVHPGGIRTNIVRNARFHKASKPGVTHEEAAAYFDKYLVWTGADRAARVIIEGIKKNKSRILVGLDAHVYDVCQRFFPVLWQRLMAFL
jgi:NAD(P)-dependent dehydrogenase (short-subunit alcohol dehydrogenase family)